MNRTSTKDEISKRPIFHRSYRHLSRPAWELVLGVFWGILADVLLLWFAGRLFRIHGHMAHRLLEWADVPVRSHPAAIGTLTFPIPEVPTFLPFHDWYSAIVAVGGTIVFAFTVLPLERLRPSKVLLGFFGLVCAISGGFFFFRGIRFPYSVLDFAEVWTFAEFSLWMVIPLLYVFLLAPLPLSPPLVFVYIAGTIGYAFAFSILRLSALLALFHFGGLIWMAPAYFVFGFLADFLYIVAFYSMAVSQAGEKIRRDRKGWRW